MFIAAGPRSDGLLALHSVDLQSSVTADLRTLARDSEDLLKATAGDVSEKAREARQRVLLALEKARASCDDMQEETMARARAAANIVRNHSARFGAQMPIRSPGRSPLARKPRASSSTASSSPT